MYDEQQQRIIAECAALTLADLGVLNLDDQLEKLSGRLWFLEACASEIHPEIVQSLHNAMLAATTLANDAVTSVRDLLTVLPDPMR